MTLLKAFTSTLRHSAQNLLPIVLVVAFFQFLVMQQVPDDLWSIGLGLLIVVLGVLRLGECNVLFLKYLPE